MGRTKQKDRDPEYNMTYPRSSLLDAVTNVLTELSLQREIEYGAAPYVWNAVPRKTESRGQHDTFNRLRVGQLNKSLAIRQDLTGEEVSKRYREREEGR